MTLIPFVRQTHRSVGGVQRVVFSMTQLYLGKVGEEEVRLLGCQLHLKRILVL